MSLPPIKLPRFTAARLAFGLLACAAVTHFTVGDSPWQPRQSSSAVIAMAP